MVRKAPVLDVILYSREQIKKEMAALVEHRTDEDGAAEEEAVPSPASVGGQEAPWGIISIKPQVSGK